MRRMGIAGACLLALVVAGLLAGSASAATAPEFKVCAKAKTTGKGNYEDKVCSKLLSGTPGTPESGTGKYERASWEAAKKKKFKAKNVGHVKLLIIDPTMEGKVDSVTECEQEKTEGEVTGPKTEKWKTTYKKCKVEAEDKGVKFDGPCTSPSAKKTGEIITEPQEGTLVFTNSTKTAAGLRVKPQTGEVLVKYSCIQGLVEDAETGEFIVQRTGNTNIANKKTDTVGVAGPKNGQVPYYEEETNTEAQGFEYFVFAYCVKEEEEKGLSEPEAQVACATRLGPPPPKPLTGVANVTGGAEATAPQTLDATSEDKGEAFLIET